MGSKRQLVVLQDVDDNYAPPEQPVLLLATAGGSVTLEIAEFVETNRAMTTSGRASITVNIRDLIQAVDFLSK